MFLALCDWSSCMCFSLFFFFKQKTAYEMRISDWSSDVCSSDLPHLVGRELAVEQRGNGGFAGSQLRFQPRRGPRQPVQDRGQQRFAVGVEQRQRKIGRASCRERVCQYV